MLKKKAPEFLVYIYKWAGLGILIGIIAGVGAIVFMLLLKFSTWFFLEELVGYHPPLAAGEGVTAFPPFEGVRWFLIPVVTTVGGLITGLIVYTFAPEAEGHGTDAVIESFHRLGGRIRGRVPIVKAIASAITIGSGGSAGREGPIAQIGAGFASLLAKLLKLSDHDRRIMIVAGAGAGIGSVFKAPLGAAIFAIEVLYRRDFEVDALIPSFISSVVGYSIFSSFFGFSPIFSSPSFEVIPPLSFIFYAVLGVVSGLAAIVYVNMFYGLRDKFFKKIPVPLIVKPAIGGFLIGLLGMIAPQVLGTSYGWVQLAIYGQLAISTMLIVAILKMAATSFTISSGGSGGVFAPSLVIGAMIGGALGTLFYSSFPDLAISPACFILVGMAAFFAGAAKVPIAAMIMVAEMTGNYKLLIPATIACSISYVLSGKWSIYEKQVDSRIESPAHRGEFSVDVLEQVKVKSVMTTKVVTVSPDMKVRDISRLIARYGHLGYPVVDKGRLIGIVTYSDILKVRHPEESEVKIREVMSKRLIVTYPDETLDRALHKMYFHNVGRLPVVDPENPTKLLGIVTKRDLIRGHEISRFGETVSRVRDVLKLLTVEEVMHKHFTILELEHGYNLNELIDMIIHCKHPAIVAIKDGKPVGIVTCRSVLEAHLNGKKSPIRELFKEGREPIAAYPDESIRAALDKMMTYKLEALPVIDRSRPDKLVGLITIKDVVRIIALESLG